MQSNYHNVFLHCALGHAGKCITLLHSVNRINMPAKQSMSWTFSQQWKKADLYNKDTHLDFTTSVHTYLAASQEYRHHCY